MIGLQYWSQHCRLVSRVQDAQPFSCVWVGLVVIILGRRESIAWVLIQRRNWWHVSMLERRALGAVEVVWLRLLVGVPVIQGQ